MGLGFIKMADDSIEIFFQKTIFIQRFNIDKLSIDYNYEKLYSRAEREATQYIQWLERRCWLDPMCLRKKIIAMFFHRYINFMA